MIITRLSEMLGKDHDSIPSFPLPWTLHVSEFLLSVSSNNFAFVLVFYHDLRMTHVLDVC